MNLGDLQPEPVLWHEDSGRKPWENGRKPWENGKKPWENGRYAMIEYPFD